MWRDHGVCVDPKYDPNDWFPIRSTPDAFIAEVEGRCQRCPVMLRCVDEEAAYGIWGGALRKRWDDETN